MLWWLLQRYAAPAAGAGGSTAGCEGGPAAAEELRLSYDDFTQVAAEAREAIGPSADAYLQASTFLRLPRDAGGCVPAAALFRYCAARSAQIQLVGGWVGGWKGCFRGRLVGKTAGRSCTDLAAWLVTPAQPNPSANSRSHLNSEWSWGCWMPLARERCHPPSCAAGWRGARRWRPAARHCCRRATGALPCWRASWCCTDGAGGCRCGSSSAALKGLSWRLRCTPGMQPRPPL